MTNPIDMRADICNTSDDAAVERFKATLRHLGAQSIDQSWAIGVDVYKLQIDKDVLTIFSDAWEIDIEGPDLLVQKVLELFKQQR